MEQEPKIGHGEEGLSNEVVAAIGELENIYERGGSENDEGVLQPGVLHFEETKKKIREIILYRFGGNRAEELANEVVAAIDELENNYEWGGSENDEGVLESGMLHFEETKKKIRELILAETRAD